MNDSWDDMRKQIIESIRQMSDATRRAIDSLNVSWIQELSKTFSDIKLARIAKNAQTIINTFVEALPSSDQWIKGAKRWSEYGWCTLGYLDLISIINPPNNLLEANRIGRKEITENILSRVCEHVSSHMRKDEYSDLQFLLNNKRYKMAAMLLTTTIERTLIYTPNKVQRKERAKQTIEDLEKRSSDSIWIKILTITIINVFNYYFTNAKNFDRKREGELNRNFLHHGMMYKPVSRTTCIKLILMLDTIIYIHEYALL